MANILFLTPQLPYPPHQGTSLRNFHILRGLAGQHTLSLLSFVESNQRSETEAIRPLLDLLLALETVPVPPRSVATRLRQLLVTRQPDMAHRLASAHFDVILRQLLQRNNFDIVQIEGIELARYLSTIRTVSPRSHVVFDDHNAEAELQRRNMLTDLRQPRRWLAAAYSWVQVQRLRRFERWALQNADAVTAVSQADQQYLQRLLASSGSSIHVIPNCIDVTAYEQTDETVTAADVTFDLVFSGKMDYRPNVDAVLWFADTVWPGIKAQRPETTWAIVGQKPHPRLERLHSLDGVKVTGWVESVRPYLNNAAVVIMPFRIGSGTRLKLIEAMAARRAIVSTPIGAEGFPVQHRQELWLAESATDMEAAVLHLLNHPEERRQLGQRAHQFAQPYDWRQVIPRFQAVYDMLLASN